METVRERFFEYVPRPMPTESLSALRFVKPVGWAIVVSIVIGVTASGLARATLNLDAALIEKPHIAIYLLLPEEEITNVEVLKETEDQGEYLIDTKEGKKFVVMKRGETEWYVSLVERLHE